MAVAADMPTRIAPGGTVNVSTCQCSTAAFSGHPRSSGCSSDFAENRTVQNPISGAWLGRTSPPSASATSCAPRQMASVILPARNASRMKAFSARSHGQIFLVVHAHGPAQNQQAIKISQRWKYWVRLEQLGECERMAVRRQPVGRVAGAFVGHVLEAVEAHDFVVFCRLKQNVMLSAAEASRVQ